MVSSKTTYYQYLYKIAWNQASLSFILATYNNSLRPLIRVGKWRCRKRGFGSIGIFQIKIKPKTPTNLFRWMIKLHWKKPPSYNHGLLRIFKTPLSLRSDQFLRTISSLSFGTLSLALKFDTLSPSITSGGDCLFLGSSPFNFSWDGILFPNHLPHFE